MLRSNTYLTVHAPATDRKSCATSCAVFFFKFYGTNEGQRVSKNVSKTLGYKVTGGIIRLIRTSCSVCVPILIFWTVSQKLTKFDYKFHIFGGHRKVVCINSRTSLMTLKRRFEFATLVPLSLNVKRIMSSIWSIEFWGGSVVSGENVYVWWLVIYLKNMKYCQRCLHRI